MAACSLSASYQKPPLLGDQGGGLEFRASGFRFLNWGHRKQL